jgi:FixJ family two-component response regulator
MGFKVKAFAEAEQFLISGDSDETHCLILDVRVGR